MDKGLGLADIQSMIEMSGDYIDIVKLGWGTSYVTPILRKKLDLYKSLGIPVVCGGTLLEVAEARGRIDDYRTWLTAQGFTHVEVSDGTIDMSRERKLELISMFAKDFEVLSEVGSKDAEEIYAPYQWVEWIKEELAAGSWKVITEARESGTAGIFRNTGEVRSGLIDEIAHEIDPPQQADVHPVDLRHRRKSAGGRMPDESVRRREVDQGVGLGGETIKSAGDALEGGEDGLGLVDHGASCAMSRRL
jgi:phosphosulfolactate synthase